MNFKDLSILFVLIMASNAYAPITRVSSDPGLSTVSEVFPLLRTVSAPAILTATDVTLSNFAGSTVTIRVPAGVEGIAKYKFLRRSVAKAIGSEIFRTHVIDNEIGANYVVNSLMLDFMNANIEDPQTHTAFGIIGLRINNFLICFRVNYLPEENEDLFKQRINLCPSLIALLDFAVGPATISNLEGNPAIVVPRGSIIPFLDAASLADCPPVDADKAGKLLDYLEIDTILNPNGVVEALLNI